jgi:hypothetical protein
MAYGQFTSYAPNPNIPGAYDFARVNGPPLTFGGPEAEQIKTRLDAYNSVNQPMVAGPGGGAPPGEDAPVPPPTNAGYAPLDPPAVPPGDRPVMLNAMNTGWKLDETGRPYRESAGSPGVSKGQLETKATQGTALPTAQSESVSGGFERDEKYLADREAIGGAEIAALERQRKADLDAEAAGRNVAQQQFVAQTAQRDEAQRFVDDVTAQVKVAQVNRDEALREYTGSKVDPNRIFSGEGGDARRTVSAIAAGLGAYAATIGKTQNFALQIIDNQIARDIAAQEADIRIKKDKSDTLLGELMRKRDMTLPQAKMTAEAIQRDWARNQAILARGASSNEGINAKYDALLGKMQKDDLDFREKYDQDAAGTATKAVQAKIVYPEAGSAGGRVYATPDEAVSLAGKTAGTEGQVAGTAKVIGEIGKGGAKAAGSRKAQALAANEAADAALSELENREEKAGWPSVVRTGVGATDHSQYVGSAVESMAPGLGRGLEGNAPNESTMQAIRSGLMSMSGDKRKAAIREYRQRLRETRKSLEQAPDNWSDEPRAERSE